MRACAQTRKVNVKPTCVLVLCPRTGNPKAWRLPRYDPDSFNRLISSRTCLRRSFSIFMSDKAAVRSRTCLFASSPTLHVGWMWKRARRRALARGPTPKNVSRDFYVNRQNRVKTVWTSRNLAAGSKSWDRDALTLTRFLSGKFTPRMKTYITVSMHNCGEKNLGNTILVN
jgi:hypothetical protein